MNSPAHVEVEWKYGADGTPTGFHARVARNAPDEMPSYTRRHYRLTWSLRDNDGAKLAGKEVSFQTIGSAQEIAASFAATSSKSLTLHLVIYRSIGFVVAKKKLFWWQPRTGGMTLEEMKRKGMKTPE